MAGLSYYVLEEDGQWKVRFKGRDYLYASREAALSAAMETAQKISLIEEQVQVFLHSDDGKWQVIWTSHPEDSFEGSTDHFINGFAAFGAFIPFVAELWDRSSL